MGIVRNLSKAGIVELARVSSGAHPDQARAIGHRRPPHFIIVDALAFPIDAILHSMIGFAREVHIPAMGKVPALRQTHTQDGIAGVHQGEIDGLIGGAARIGLHVDVFGAKELDSTLARRVLNNIDILIAAVVTLAGIALGILVGQYRA